MTAPPGGESIDEQFHKFAFFASEHAKEYAAKHVRGSYLDDNVKEKGKTPGVFLLAGDHKTWLFFEINNVYPQNLTTPKLYVSFSDISSLSPDRLKKFLGALRDAGYKGGIKTVQDLFSVWISDHVVFHADIANLQIAERVARDFFGPKEIAFTEIGFDAEKNSWSGNLAKEAEKKWQANDFTPIDREKFIKELGGDLTIPTAAPQAAPARGPALTDNDVAGAHSFAAELLHAEALGVGIATVTRRAACLFVSHDALLKTCCFGL